jgi:hypothetical protein
MRRALEGRTALRDPASVVAGVLDREAERVFGPPAPGGDHRSRRYLMPLAVAFGRGRQAAQEVAVHLVPLGDAEGGAAWSLEWAPTGAAAVLPELEGTLEVRPDGDGCELVFRGSYRPPLGPVGAFGDGVLGHRVARRTIDRFVSDVRERLVEVLQQRADTAPLPAAPTPPDLRPDPHGDGADASDVVDLREAAPSENWLG